MTRPAPRQRGQRVNHAARVVLSLAAVLSVATPSVATPDTTALLDELDLAGYADADRPPPFSGVTLEGRPLSLAALQGRVVILTFWATWCPPCRAEMMLFERLHGELASSGLTIVGINVREAPSAMAPYAGELGLTFPLLVDRRGEIQSRYGVIGLPTTFLIARDGRAVARAIGERDWLAPAARALIASLLAEPAPRR